MGGRTLFKAHRPWLPLTLILGALAAQDVVPCTLQRRGEEWVGTCGAVFEGPLSIRLRPESTVTTGLWRTDWRPAFLAVGEATFGDLPATPIELASDSAGDGLTRTLLGWFPIHAVQVDSARLRFRLDVSAEVPPSDLDAAILRRASTLLSSDATWDRADDRICVPTDTTWSIYCALKRATIEVTGAFHHRRPALQLVRRLVDERTTGRDYEHRLRDYNNDPSTGLDDVRDLFLAALAVMGAPGL